MKRGVICAVFCLIVAVGLAACGGSSNSGSGGSPDKTTPLRPTDLLASAASSSSIALNWTASSDDVGVTGYKIFRNGSQISTSTANAFSDTGLSSSKTYTYNVSAYDAAGNESAQSSSATATTLATNASDTIAPSTPTNLIATAVSSTQINLTWYASTDNIEIAGYEVWRGTSKIATVTITAYSDGGLAASTSYTYKVKAIDVANNVSAASNVATATTYTPPSNIFDLVGDWAAGSEISFSVSADGILTNFKSTLPTNGECFGNGSSFEATYSNVAIDMTDFSIAATYSQVKYSTTYGASINGKFSSAFTMEGTWSAGYSNICSNSGSGTFKATKTATGATSVPDLAATPDVNAVSLGWGSVAGATSYNVYYGTSSGVTILNGVAIKSITSTSYTVPGLINDTTYYFVVTAAGPDWESTATSQVNATPRTLPTLISQMLTAGDTSGAEARIQGIFNGTDANIDSAVSVLMNTTAGDYIMANMMGQTYVATTVVKAALHDNSAMSRLIADAAAKTSPTNTSSSGSLGALINYFNDKLTITTAGGISDKQIIAQKLVDAIHLLKPGGWSYTNTLFYDGYCTFSSYVVSCN